MDWFLWTERLLLDEKWNWYVQGWRTTASGRKQKHLEPKIYSKYIEVKIMSNDKDWQRRSDEWIDATNESRKQKEKRNAKNSDNQTKPKDGEQNVKIDKQK